MDQIEFCTMVILIIITVLNIVNGAIYFIIFKIIEIMLKDISKSRSEIVNLITENSYNTVTLYDLITDLKESGVIDQDFDISYYEENIKRRDEK